MCGVMQTDDDVSSLSLSATAISDFGLQNRYMTVLTNRVVIMRPFNFVSAWILHNEDGGCGGGAFFNKKMYEPDTKMICGTSRKFKIMPIHCYDLCTVL